MRGIFIVSAVGLALGCGKGGLSTEAADAVPDLSKALDDENEEVREAAAASLAKIGKPAVPALIAALTKGSQRSHKNAAYALGSICQGLGLEAVKPLDPKTKEALPELLKLLSAADQKRKLELALLLAAIDAKDTKVATVISPVLVAALRPETIHEEPSQAVLEAIAAIGQPVVDDIFKALAKANDIGDINATNRKALFIALQRLGREAFSEGNAQTLRQYWTTEEYRDVQEEAGKALQVMLPP
jgi:HEAT repeat protein